LLVILNLLVLLVCVLLAMALIGLWRIPPGDAGGELAMAAMNKL
jgi:hypothetical protein